jgi:iron complex outermembrane receptor protein
VLEELSLFASYARPFKSPNVDDFSAFIPGGTFIGNVDIQPQQGDEYEIGLQWQQATLGSAHVSVFHKRVDDEILFNALTFQNQNYDTRRTGLEVSLDPKLPIAGLTSSWHYTFLEAEFRKGSFKGNTLPGVPEHALKNHTAYEPLEGLLFWWDWTLINDFFRINDFANALPGDNYGLMDVGVRFTYRDTTVFFTIENVTDEEYTSFQSSNGTTVATGENPAPPRAYLTGITWQF